MLSQDAKKCVWGHICSRCVKTRNEKGRGGGKHAGHGSRIWAGKNERRKGSTSWVFYVQEQLNKFLISWKPELKGEMVQQQDDIKGRLWRILRTYTNAFIALIAYLRSSSTEQSHQNSNLLRQKEGKVIVVISKENKKEQFRGMRKAKENMIICKRIIRVEKIQRVKWRKWSNE